MSVKSKKNPRPKVELNTEPQQDVTAPKVTEEVLRQKEADLAGLQRLAHIGSWYWDAKTDVTTGSDELLRIYGFDPATQTMLDFTEQKGRCYPPADWELINEATQETMRTGAGYELDVQAFRNGAPIWVTTRSEIVRDADGRVLGLRGTVQDITERKLAEKERETSIEFLRMVHESLTMQDLIDGAVAFFQQQIGCEAVGIRLQKGEDFPYFTSNGFPEGFLLTENTLCARDHDGVIIRDGAGDPVLECMCGNVICGRFDPAKPFFTANGSFWTNSTTKLLASTSEADRQSRTRNRCHGEGYESVALIPLRAGQKRLGLIQLNDSRPEMFAAKNIELWERLFGYLALAVARFKADEETRESESRFHDIARASADWIWEVDLAGNYTFASKGVAQTLGYTVAEVLRLSPFDLMPPGEAERVRQEFNVIVDRRVAFRDLENVNVHKNGDLRHILTNGVPFFDDQGELLGYRGVDKDITARKQAEVLLLQKNCELETARIKSENDRRLLWDMMAALPIGVAITNAWGGLMRTNTAFERIWSGPRPETSSVEDYTRYKAWRLDTGNPVAPNEWASALALLTGETVDGQLFKIQRFDGSEAYVLNSAAPIRDIEGRIVGSAVAIQDITELKRTEAALRESEALFRSVFQSAAIGIVMATAGGRIQLANDAFCRMLGRTREALIGLNALEITHADDLPANAELIRRAVAGEIQGYTLEKRYLRPDGTPLWVNLTVTEVTDESGHPLHNIAVVEDITLRKATEKVLLDSLREKEVLLKEVHHRVKNNLQVISSLVDLQADSLDNPALAGLFQDVRDRVRSMALVHEKLYRSDNLASVEFAEYASGLLNYLWRAHNESGSKVSLYLDLQPVLLAVESAVPCGLILNELAVNTLKHAFTGRDSGNVAVMLHNEPEGHVSLCVRDNGTGLRPNLNWRQSSTLGLNLVQMLAKQLKAKVEVKSDGGTEFRIVFRPRPVKSFAG